MIRIMQNFLIAAVLTICVFTTREANTAEKSFEYIVGRVVGHAVVCERLGGYRYKNLSRVKALFKGDPEYQRGYRDQNPDYGDFIGDHRACRRNVEDLETILQRKGATSQAASSPKAAKAPKIRRVPFVASWEGEFASVSGTLEYTANKPSGSISAPWPDGTYKCTGTFHITSGKYGTNEMPNGPWALSCTNGKTATGEFESHQRGKGKGKGVDRSGKIVEIAFGEGLAAQMGTRNKTTPEQLSDWSKYRLCTTALQRENVAWDATPALKTRVTEAKRRGYTPASCAKALGRTATVAKSTSSQSNTSDQSFKRTMCESSKASSKVQASFMQSLSENELTKFLEAGQDCSIF